MIQRRCQSAPLKLALLFLLAAGSMACLAIPRLNAAASESHKAYTMLHVDNVAERSARSLVHWASIALGGVRLGAQVESPYREVDRMLAGAAEKRRVAIAICKGLAIVSAAYIVLTFVVAGRRHAAVQAACLVACVWLAIGLAAPMMSLIAKVNAPILGDIVLRHETKSIFGVTRTLLDSSNWPIGVILLVCGIVAPCIKLVALLCSAAYPDRRAGKLAASVGSTLAPWAMVDVFTLGIVIAFFGAGPDASINARLEPGAYFFAGHCVLSMVVAHLVHAHYAQISVPSRFCPEGNAQ